MKTNAVLSYTSQYIQMLDKFLCMFGWGKLWSRQYGVFGIPVVYSKVENLETIEEVEGTDAHVRYRPCL
jgi:hypothetical protein